WRPLDRALSLVWCTPNMHKIHHSRAPEQTDSNYGNIFALFDRGLRTFTPTDRALTVAYGLEDIDATRAKSLRALLRMPLGEARKLFPPLPSPYLYPQVGPLDTGRKGGHLSVSVRSLPGDESPG